MKRETTIRGRFVNEFNMRVVCYFFFMFLAMAPSMGRAALIDLHDFFIFSGDPITVSVDGFSATLGQLASGNPVELINDPVLGDPIVIASAANTLLSFDYEFTEAAGEDDVFSVFVVDTNTGVSPGSDYQFITQDTSEEHVVFDLSLLMITPDLGFGLVFRLTPGINDSGLASSVTVSNVRTDLIPEPGTGILLGLMGAGIFSMSATGRIRSAS